MEDLDEAISVSRKLTELISMPTDSHEVLKRSTVLRRTAMLLLKKNECDGTRHRSEEAVAISREALLLNQDESHRASLLHMLGMSLGDYYKMTGEIGHLREAIIVLREGAALSPDELKGDTFYQLAEFLASRFHAIGSLRDLQDSLQFIRMSIRFTTPNDHALTRRRHHLATLLGRVSRTSAGSLHDLEESISILREISSTANIEDRARYLLSLSKSLFDYKLFPSIREELVKISREKAMDIADAIADVRQLKELRDIPGIRPIFEGLEIAQQALDAVPAANTTLWALCKSSFAQWLDARDTKIVSIGLKHFLTESMIDEAPRAYKEALSRLPEGHRDRPPILHSLGFALMERSTWLQVSTDNRGQEGLLLLQRVLQTPTGSTRSLLSTGKASMEYCANNLDWQQAYEIAKVVSNLVPKLVPQSLVASDKQRNLVQLAGFASSAAAIALAAGKAPDVALEFLEQGRQVLLISSEQLRASVNDLQEAHPELAQRLTHLQKELDGVDETYDIETLSHPLLHKPDRHAVSDEFERYLLEIRKQTGFERFLVPLEEDDIIFAADHGPVVVLNVSKYRCDAILIQDRRIRSISLPGLKHDDVELLAQRRNRGSPVVLTWLWETIANPVLNALGYAHQPPDGEQWPRLWWIPTGFLSNFPLHAAGRHMEGRFETVLDRVISSYSLSVQTIEQGRSRPALGFAAMKALLVAAEETANVSTLKYATQEVKAVKHILTPVISECIIAGDYKEEVISKLPDCGIFHFAGHGLTDKKDPLKSHLLLATEGRRVDPFTVATLMKLNLRDKSPFLAYLSACETGRVGAVEHADENIHLISAFQFAGFRHVIGTLWEVKDDACKEMAALTYEWIRKSAQHDRGGVTDYAISQALHEAMRARRAQWVKICEKKTPDSSRKKKKKKKHPLRKCDSTTTSHNVSSVVYSDCHIDPQRDVVSTDEEDEDEDEYGEEEEDGSSKNSLDWVPYVHFGV
ncbi:CHAT domain-containing protein [Xylariaceae sp. FL0255]|nr:CHAT domain-containing protein [Xylariaceae sp. FL0255]